MSRSLESHSLYRHYKGGLYYVIGEALHTETNERMVVYHALYNERELFTRPMDMFLSEVEEADSSDNVAGQKHRFELVEG